MSFPNYKTVKHKFLFWGWEEKIKDNWEHITFCNNPTIGKTIYCLYCTGKVAIAEEQGKRFKYCTLCLSKILNNPALK